MAADLYSTKSTTAWLVQRIEGLSILTDDFTGLVIFRRRCSLGGDDHVVTKSMMGLKTVVFPADWWASGVADTELHDCCEIQLGPAGKPRFVPEPACHTTGPYR